MNDRQREQKQRVKEGAAGATLLDVQITQAQTNSAIYTWDRGYGRLRLTGIAAASPGLPANLASFRLGEQQDIPVLLLASVSLSPGTRARARLLGALGSQPEVKEPQTLPADGWVFVAAAEDDPAFSAVSSMERLAPSLLHPLQAHVEEQMRADSQFERAVLQTYSAVNAASLLRETRLALKRQQRLHPRERRGDRSKEEQPVAWRASDNLPADLLVELRQGAQRDASSARTEYLIRLVPQRFQRALANLLLDDEHVLAFLERPLLRHRTGWFGTRTWRSNAGLFLVTDRQVLWLRDFLTPGKDMVEGGYVVHSAPLARLGGVDLLPAGRAPASIATHLATPESPYLRLVLACRSEPGSELFAVEFPQQVESAKALEHLIMLLRTFLPAVHGWEDRRLLCLPQVRMWMPQGEEAVRLQGLGGRVPAHIVQRLEQQLRLTLQGSSEEVLVSAAVPALEEHMTPARLVVLTSQAVFLLDDRSGKSARHARETPGAGVQISRYDLATISSVQLRYSLLGSSLSLFLPRIRGQPQQLIVPFHSPAIAWFLPLFTRLRLLLTKPFCNKEAP